MPHCSQLKAQSAIISASRRCFHDSLSAVVPSARVNLLFICASLCNVRVRGRSVCVCVCGFHWPVSRMPHLHLCGGRQSSHRFLKMKWVFLIPLNQGSLLIRNLVKDHSDREEKKRPAAHHIMSSSDRMSLSEDVCYQWGGASFYIFIMWFSSAVSLYLPVFSSKSESKPTHFVWNSI